jgi:YfiH family protein
LLRLRHETPVGTIETRFYGAERPGFGANTNQTYAEILQTLEPVSAMRYLEQVHGDRIQTLTMAEPGIELVGEGDAMITGDRGTALVIRTADCIPILIFCPESGTIAAVHAGWRGLAAKIVTQTISALCNDRSARKAGLHFMVGPFIARDSYEVGDEVASQFLPGASHVRPNAKYSLDLEKILRAEFAANAINEDQVEWHHADTFVSPGWYSARRGDSLRNFSLIARF